MVWEVMIASRLLNQAFTNTPSILLYFYFFRQFQTGHAYYPTTLVCRCPTFKHANHRLSKPGVQLAPFLRAS